MIGKALLLTLRSYLDSESHEGCAWRLFCDVECPEVEQGGYCFVQKFTRVQRFARRQESL